MTARPSRRSPRRQVIRDSDGCLYDALTDEPISRADLRDHIGDGGFIEAHRRGSGAVCTVQVVRELLQENLLLGAALGLPPGGAGHDPMELLGRLVRVAEVFAQSGTDRRDRPRLARGDQPQTIDPAGGAPGHP